MKLFKSYFRKAKETDVLLAIILICFLIMSSIQLLSLEQYEYIKEMCLYIVVTVLSLELIIDEKDE